MINGVWKHMNVTRKDKWKKDELQEMNRKTRKLKTINKKLHPRSDVAQLYVSWKNGGKGLIGCENSVKSEKMAQVSISKTKNHYQLQSEKVEL